MKQLRQLLLIYVNGVLFPAFNFHLETGDTVLKNTISLDMEQVRTVFPSFHIEKIDTNDNRGYFTFGGEIEFFYVVLFLNVHFV